MSRTTTLFVPVLAVMLCFAGAAHAQSPWKVNAAVEFHATLFNGTPNSPLLGLNAGWAVRGGASQERWGLFLQAEQNLWMGTEYGAQVVPGSLNMGVGGELYFANGLLRSSLALGPSLLLFDTALDKAGQVGVFLDFRPLGLRWHLTPGLTLGLDPFSFAVTAPVLSGIPLVRIQNRTTFVLEGHFP